MHFSRAQSPIGLQDPQPGVHQGRGRLLQEDLIGHLKQQIASLDQHTKSLMKMTLYRISRNANASVSSPKPKPCVP